MNMLSIDYMVFLLFVLCKLVVELIVGSWMELCMVGMVIGLVMGVDYMFNLMFLIVGLYIEGGVLVL